MGIKRKGKKMVVTHKLSLSSCCCRVPECTVWSVWRVHSWEFMFGYILFIVVFIVVLAVEADCLCGLTVLVGS